MSKNYLLGVTVGGYVVTSLTVFCFGGALLSSNMPKVGDLQAFLLLIPGFYVGLLGYVQIHGAEYFGLRPCEGLTKFALWLNAIPIGGFLALFLAKDLFSGNTYLSVLPLGLFLLIVLSFVGGLVLSVVNVLWILIAGKARTLLVAMVIFCLLPGVWPAYRMGIFTPDVGRYATRENATIRLHPSDVSFQIPSDWLYWNAKFHNNFHLTHRELRSVRFGAGEWDYEYGEVVNSALPFEDCAAHLGGEGWGRDGVSFGDLQMRAYVTDLSTEEVFRRISGPAVATAKSYQKGAGKVYAEVEEVGVWRKAVIRYSLFCGDYGGVANVEFYVRPVSKYRLVMVFMGTLESEKRSILASVIAPSSPEQN